jgi:hypothetical protein
MVLDEDLNVLGLPWRNPAKKGRGLVSLAAALINAHAF